MNNDIQESTQRREEIFLEGPRSRSRELEVPHYAHQRDQGLPPPLIALSKLPPPGRRTEHLEPGHHSDRS